MPTLLQNLEWANHNAVRNYPLSGDATAVDLSGSFHLPQSFLIACYLPIHAGLDVDPGKFFIKTIGAYATGYSVIVGYQPETGDAIPVAAAQIPRAAHVPGRSYNLGGLDDFADSIGRITIGILDDIDNQPAGLWQFDLDGGLLEADAIRPMIRGISSISVANGADVIGPLYGDILLRAGTNYRIDYAEVSGQPQLTFNAMRGEGLQEDCVCSDDTAVPIVTVNGVGPDSAGNLTLLGSSCIDVDAIQNGLQLTDTCADPCCGCPELTKLTEALEGFGAQATTLENFLVQLEASVTQMNLVVLGSRLGDRNCVTG